MTDEVVKKGNLNFYRSNIYNGYSLLLHRETPTRAKLSTEVRGTIEVGDQEVLDSHLFELRASGVSFEYIPNFKDCFDSEKAVGKFVGSESLADNIVYNNDMNLGLTDDEIGAGIVFREAEKLYKELKQSIAAKFKDKFQSPKLPYNISAAIDLDKIYGDRADAIREWMNDPSKPREFGAREGGNVLRLSENGRKIEALSSYDMGIRSAEAIAKAAIEVWATVTFTKSDDHYGRNLIVPRNRVTHDLRVHENHLRIGCQSIPRPEIERIARLLEWA